LQPVFADGAYVPIEVRGEQRERVIAFARVAGSQAVIVAVGRHFVPFARGGREWPTPAHWEATLALPGFSSLQNALADGPGLSGQDLPLSTLFDPLPVAVLRAVPVSTGGPIRSRSRRPARATA
jgi:(1->4)-alpha-D-glucan 1-alpha-D-glucosylmutase